MLVAIILLSVAVFALLVGIIYMRKKKMKDMSKPQDQDTNQFPVKLSSEMVNVAPVPIEKTNS